MSHSCSIIVEFINVVNSLNINKINVEKLFTFNNNFNINLYREFDKDENRERIFIKLFTILFF